MRRIRATRRTPNASEASAERRATDGKWRNINELQSLAVDFPKLRDTLTV
jgi:hypothetical protein